MNVDEKIEAIKIIGATGVLIDRVIQDIFSLFPNTSVFNDFISKQKDLWSNIVFSETSTLNTFKEYFENFYRFYKTAYRNTHSIKVASDTEKLYWLGMAMSPQALSNLSLENRKLILFFVVEEKLSEYLEKDEEEDYVIRIIQSFGFDNSKAFIDEFLFWLISNEKVFSKGKSTYYQVIYDRMSTSWNITKSLYTIDNWLSGTDFYPKDTKEAFVQIVYSLWLDSKYNPYNAVGNLKEHVIGIKSLDSNKVEFTQNPTSDGNPYLFNYSLVPGYESFSSSEDTNCAAWPQYCKESVFYRQTSYAQNAAPMVLPYESKSIGGIFSDNFTFTFSGNKIKAYQESLPIGYYPPKDENNDGEADETGDRGRVIRRDLLFGVYDIFQPVTLLNLDIDTNVPILTTKGNPTQIGEQDINSFIPVFVLKFIDDSGDRSDNEKIAGYVLDGVLTLSGIGNLSKLRHLRWFGGASGLISMNFVRVVIGGVELSSSVLSFLGNFVDCGDNQTCKNVKALLMIVEVVAGGVDALDGLVTNALKKQSRKTIEDAGGGTTSTERIDNLKQKIQEIDPNASESIVEETAEKIHDLAKYEGLVDEFFDFIDLLEDLNYSTFRSKLLDLYNNGDNPEEIAKFIAFLRRDEDVFKIFDDNPNFLSDLNDINRVKKVAKIGEIFKDIKNNISKEPFDISSGKGFSFNRWEKVNEVLTDTGELLHSDQDIFDMISHGLDLNPKVPENWIEGIIRKVFRARKQKSKSEIIGNGTVGDSQEALGELGVASEIINRVPPRLLWCFPNFDLYLEFLDVFERRILDRFGIKDILDRKLLVGGSVHTKKSPPDIDMVKYLTKEQYKALHQRQIDFINLEIKTKRANGDFVRESTEGENLIKRINEEIKEIDHPSFNLKLKEEKFGIGRLKAFNYNNQGEVIGTTNLRQALLKDPEIKNILTQLNLRDKKIDLLLFTEEGALAGKSIPPETIINF